ncbi:MBL fold metallo-hydrolase [Salicibibacter kimchii]|uniref:MBL fold metallo-hydrolase n=1 Tax=Salicibibacter kimchii TaxID=2099786 RepID=A0A345C117_9BACI|nr:MBL fold metallo-hydrolase [Salicibibacter kimchii]AXF56898.1 MBL fold metallo-hydrolase [Salicibibacter kimchii]
MKIEKKNHTVYPIIVPVNNNLKSINFYLYQSGKTLTLIDAGLNNEECWNALLETLKTNGFSLQDISQILLTHHHVDHVGLVDRVVSEHPISVYAHPYSIPRLKRERDFMERRVEFFETLYREADCGEAGENQVRYLKNALQKNEKKAMQTDIQSLEQAQIDLEITEVPGHAPDQVSFFHKETGSLFGGDLLIQHISSNALAEPDFKGRRQRPLLQHMDSMKAADSLQPSTVYSGHGEVIQRTSNLVDMRLREIEEKADKLAKLIPEGLTTAAAIAKSYYEKRYDSQFSLVMSEILGHLDYLEAKERIGKEKKVGVWHYHVT